MRLAEKLKTLSQKAQTLAAKALAFDWDIDWARAYKSVGVVQGRGLRDELQAAELVDAQGWTPTGRAVVQANLESKRKGQKP